VNFTDFALKRPITVLMLIIVVIILGSVSLTRVGLDLLPEMNFPIAAVITEYRGVGPEEIETLITRPLEETLGTVTNVKQISSITASGSSIVLIEFNMGTDMDFAALEMREKIDLVRGWLPDDASQPLVFKFDPSMMPVMVVGLGGMDDLAQLKELAEETIKPRLERLEGVASVSVQGGRKREIEVRLHPAALEGYGVGIEQVIQTLAAENLTLPGGTVQEGAEELLLRTTGEFRSVEEIGEVNIMTPTGVPIKVKDLGTVTDTYSEADQVAYLNGRPAVGLLIQKQTGANTARVGQSIKRELENLRSLHQELEYTYILDQSEFIELSLASMTKNALGGALLAVLILLLFLRNFRSTLVIAIVIPISIISTFILVHFAGLTLNLMTLGGMALGVGMLVDNAIVVLENIFRLREEGKSPLEAARLGAAEVAMAVTASTLTTVAVFLPIVYVEGMITEIFKQLALTVTFSLLASLVVSLTLTPLLSSRLLVVEVNNNNHGKGGILKRYSHLFGKKLEQLDNAYGRALSWCLGNRKRVLGTAVVLFILSLVLVPFVGAEFLPATDEGRLSIAVRLPVGSTLEATEAVAERVARTAAGLPQVQDVYYTIGGSGGMGMDGSGGMGGGPEQATIDITLVPAGQRDLSTAEVAEELRKLFRDIPGAEITVAAQSMIMMGSGGAVNIAIKGDDLELLDDLAESIVAVIEEIPGVRDPDTSLREGRPELQVRPRRQRLAALGLTTGQVANAIDTALQGRVATRLRVAGEEIEIRVRLAGDQTRQDLERLVLTSPLGMKLTLADVADFVYDVSPRSIYREDQVRLVTVTADISGRDLGSVMGDIQSRVARIPLPEGYFIEYGGEYEEMASAFGGLALAGVLGVVLVYAIMAAQFESLLHPFTIMFSVPFAITGAVLGLFVTGRTLNVTSAIGGVMLAGIVVNNAIVLVDYINTLRGRGLTLETAVVTAGRTRLRPILMTTLTTILAMFPLALGIGEGAELQAPLATVVMCGLTVSTLLTLFIVPTIYTIVDGFSFRPRFSIRKLFSRAKASN
jgi:HAE1 family hydrophobic/amphiphilic exporter-1